MRLGQEPEMMWTRKTGSQLDEDLFFFLESPKIGQKNSVNFSKNLLFIEDHPNLDRKIVSISVKTSENLGQDRLMLFPASKTAPPSNTNSWLRAWFGVDFYCQNAYQVAEPDEFHQS